jgi:hypothetical protein
VIHVWTAPVEQGICHAPPLTWSGSFMCPACSRGAKAAGHDGVGGSEPHQAGAL